MTDFETFPVMMVIRFWEGSIWQISFDTFGKGHTGGFLVAGMVVLLWLYSAYRSAYIIIITSDSRRDVTSILASLIEQLVHCT